MVASTPERVMEPHSEAAQKRHDALGWPRLRGFIASFHDLRNNHATQTLPSWNAGEPYEGSARAPPGREAHSHINLAVADLGISDVHSHRCHIVNIVHHNKNTGIQGQPTS